jgi:hypothetical protein
VRKISEATGANPAWLFGLSQDSRLSLVPDDGQRELALQWEELPPPVAVA